MHTNDQPKVLPGYSDEDKNYDDPSMQLPFLIAGQFRLAPTIMTAINFIRLIVD
jgi:hypothetical protein